MTGGRVLPPAVLAQLAGSFDERGFAFVPVEADAVAFARAGSERFDSAFFFSTPAGSSAAGLGAARRATASGAGRFQQLRAALEDWRMPEPFRAFIGFSFDPAGPTDPAWRSFAAAEVVLPVATVLPTASGTVLAVAVPPGMGTDAVLERLESLEAPPDPSIPDPGSHSLASVPTVAEWREAVADAIRAIDDGSVDKVVLARSVLVHSDHPARPFDLVHQLAGAYPKCFGFAWQAEEATFVGASPELLVASVAGAVSSNPLAGSAPRGEGEDDDRALAEALMRSPKDRFEHQLVVDDVVTRLEPLLEDMTVPTGPSLKRMATVQHLSTPIQGVLAEPRHVLELVELLHPTPAVGGTPRERAVELIAKMEGFDRGWYTGGLGWSDGNGDGEFAIALRCGLIRGAEAGVYAGAGIVAGSVPDAELAETRLKLRPLLDLLAAS